MHSTSLLFTLNVNELVQTYIRLNESISDCVNMFHKCHTLRQTPWERPKPRQLRDDIEILFVAEHVE